MVYIYITSTLIYDPVTSKWVLSHQYIKENQENFDQIYCKLENNNYLHSYNEVDFVNQLQSKLELWGWYK